ncbi:ATP-dependent DNA helicase AdnA [Microbacterium invictum]
MSPVATTVNDMHHPPRALDVDGAPAGGDAAHRAVVELPADASGVVAGAPGSGKTTCLLARVAHLVAAGLSPDELLVLTPTRQTATELRDRLALAVGVATTGPLARSVAAFAYQLVRAAAVHAGEEPPQLLTGPDEDQLIADLLAGDAEDELTGSSRWPEWLPAAVRGTGGFRTEVRTFLAECTTLGIEPDRLAQLAREQDREAWTALASFAREYHRVRADMRGAHRDAAGLVREAVGLARTLPPGHPAWDVVGRYRVLLVDDAQELTLGGVELIEACRARGIAVLAFGDPDISAGAFRAATPENFARLAAAVPVHVLPTVHRGTAAQQELSAQITSRIGAAGIVAHRRRPQGGDPDASVRAFTARSTSEEHDLIARLLRERHVHEGVPWSDCVVIAHDTRQIVALEAELAAREVPTRALGQATPLADARAVRDLLRLVLLAARDPDSWTADELGDVLRGGGLDPVELRRLRTALRHVALAQADEGEIVPTGRELLASALAHPTEFVLVDTREARRAARVGTAIATLREQLAAQATAHELMWTAWESIGGERAWQAAVSGHGPLAEQAGRELDAVVALFQAAKRHGERDDGTSALTFLRGVLDSDVAEDRLTGPPPEGVVQVMTPAGALGTQFDTVVVAGVQDGVWPNLRTRGSLLDTWRLALPDGVDAVDRRRGVLHDELRLFARAVSRARRQLVVTAVDDDDTGPSVLFELLPPAEPVGSWAAHPLSLRGLVAQHRRALTDRRASAPARAAAPGQLALLAAAGVPGAEPGEWFGVAGPSSTGPLRDLQHEDVRVSPSRLQALDECQLNWVIADLGGDTGGAVAGLGTILHAALEHADGADEDALWAMVTARWSELDFESAWRDRAEQARARGLVRRLALYLRRFDAAGGRLVGAEPHFEVPIPIAGGAPHGAVLSGYIDRVELAPDGSVVIVDLKTGKNEPQSDAKVADNPQLAAYQLAFEAGAIPEVAGHPSGGAKLLVLRPTAVTKDYVEPRQRPFDDETRAAFLARVREAVGVMGGTVFTAPYEEHCRDDHTYGLCRIHTIGPVSAS